MKINDSDLFFTCSLIELIGRSTKQKRSAVVALLGEKILSHIYSNAGVLHCEPIAKNADAFIEMCNIPEGTFDNVADCKYEVPDYWTIGKVFARLIEDVASGNAIETLQEVYLSPVCDAISNYNSDFFYQPRGFIKEFYLDECKNSPKKRKTPALRFAGFTDAWEQRKFSEITFPAGEKNKDNLPLESYSITNEAGFVPQDEKFENGGTMREADKRMYYIVTPNSFAYNPARINVGSIGYQNTPKNVIVSSLYEVFKTTDDVNDRLLWHWFKSPDFRKLIEQLQEGGVRLYFYYDKLCMGKVYLPEIDEQGKIGRFFDTLDRLITLHQRKYDKLTKVKKSMLEKMFPQNGSDVPEIRFSGFSDAWEQRKLGSIVERVTRKNTNNESTLPLTISAQYGLVDQITYFNNRVASRDVSNYFLVKNGEFAYNKSSSDGFPFGAIKRLDLYPMGVLSTLYIVFSITDKEKTESDFLTVFFDTDRWHRGVAERAAEGARNHGLLNISADDFLDISLFLPKENKEQQKIGQFVNALNHLITLHQRELDRLQKIKKSCLEKMFV